MRGFKGLVFGIACALSLGAGSYAQTITVATEESPPLNFTKDGKVQGPATALVEATLKAAKLDFKVDVYPWARAMAMATEQPNVLIFSLGRTAEREPNFKWVGEITPFRYSLYKLKKRADIKLTKLDDAKKYSVGVVRDDVLAKHLLGKGFTAGSTQGLQEVNSNDLNLQKLEAGRIDMFPISEAALELRCEKNKIDCSQFEPAIELELVNHLYMAYSKATPDDVVERTRTAYKGLAKDGTVKKLLAKYWGNYTPE